MHWMPDTLRELGPGDLEWWQWIALPVAIIASYFVGAILTWGVRSVLHKLAGRTATTLDDELVARLAGPFRMLATLALVRAAVVMIDLPPHAAKIAVDLLLAALAIVLVWGALRAIDVIASRISAASWAAQRPSSRALLSLLSRAAKIIIVVFAVIGFLGSIGLPVSSLVAGLGIGGIALAFGAQKTLENLFGAIALGVDQPLREGDFVKIETDVMGTVESVGLRSTRIRTLDRTVVTLPNGRLADMRIETFAPRDRIRLSLTLGLVYGTTAEQLRQVLAGCDHVLREHPRVWSPDIVVRFLGFGASSLDVEVIATFQTSDMSEFRLFREAVLIQFMEVIERAGSTLAFPTRTVHVASASRT
jgi:MscS family membrane protein